MKTTSLLTILLCLGAIIGKAQIMNENNSRTTIEAQIESRPHSVDNDPTDGKIFGHVHANHNFIHSRATKFGINGRYEANNGGNAYFRFGLKGAQTFMLKNRKCIVVNANVYGEASPHAVEHIDGHAAGFYMYSLSMEKQAGIGLIALVNNPSRIPCVPIFMYRKQLTSKSRLDFATYLAAYSYDLSPKVRLSAGYTMHSDRFWLKTDDGKRCLDNKSLFTPQVALQWKPAKPLSVSISAGYGLVMNHKLYNSKGTHRVAELSKKSTPYFAARVSLNL